MTTIEPRTARATGLLARFASFVAERHPFALRPAVAALDILTGAQGVDESDAWAIDALREPLRRVLLQTLSDFLAPDAAAAQKLQGGVPETTPVPRPQVPARLTPNRLGRATSVMPEVPPVNHSSLRMTSHAATLNPSVANAR